MVTVTEIVKAIDGLGDANVWTRRMLYLKPKNFVELGTGQGGSGAWIMEALPPDSRFMTINYDYPSDYEFGQQLHKYRFDKRLVMLAADTLDPKTISFVEPRVDLLFIDTHHYAWQAAAELALWQRVLIDGALVIVDDLEMNDMKEFWNPLVYDKYPATACQIQGLFRYEAKRPYKNNFPRGRTPKEEAR